MTVEFNCCECGQSIVAVILEVVPEPPLCAHCLHMPGWNDDPYLRSIFAPGRRVRGAARPAEVNGHPVHYWAGRVHNRRADPARKRWKLASSRARWNMRHAAFTTGRVV